MNFFTETLFYTLPICSNKFNCNLTPECLNIYSELQLFDKYLPFTHVNTYKLIGPKACLLEQIKGCVEILQWKFVGKHSIKLYRYKCNTSIYQTRAIRVKFWNTLHINWIAIIISNKYISITTFIPHCEYSLCLFSVCCWSHFQIIEFN